jgi:DNA-directed RNA polymerase subunit omega
MKIFDTASETNGLTSEAAVTAIGNRYDLVLVGARRVRELSNGSMPKVASKHSPIVTALLEIEAGKVTKDYLYRSQNIISSKKKFYNK